MKKDISIRWRILLIFVGVMVAIIVAFFVMSRFYWNTILVRRNRETVRKTYEALLEFEKNEEQSPEAFESSLSEQPTRSRSFWR